MIIVNVSSSTDDKSKITNGLLDVSKYTENQRQNWEILNKQVSIEQPGVPWVPDIIDDDDDRETGRGLDAYKYIFYFNVSFPE